MVRSNRRGWLVRPLALLLAVCLGAVPSTLATEPDGHFRLRIERLPSADGSTVVRLKLQPFAAVVDASLTVSAPIEFELRPQTPSVLGEPLPIVTDPGTTAARASLRELDPSRVSSIELELLLPPGAYGTIDFVIEGRDANTRRIRDAVGFLVPDPGSRGKRRLGAVEFPALVLTDEGVR